MDHQPDLKNRNNGNGIITFSSEEKKSLDDCPFCSSNNLICCVKSGVSRSSGHKRKTNQNKTNPVKKYYVQCQSCFARGPLEFSKERAIDCWNGDDDYLNDVREENLAIRDD